MNRATDAGAISLGRRQFLVAGAAVGGGLALGIAPASARPSGPGVSSGPWASGKVEGAAFSAWIEIAPDDTVTVHVPMPEIGNGVMTQIAINVAEELDCDWAKIRPVFASIQRNFLEGEVYAIGFQPFFGGHGAQQPRLNHCLQLGASARERLKAAAAARWGVLPSEIATANSLLRHAASGRSLRFGEIAGEAALLTLGSEPTPKPPSQWRLIGKASPPKLNGPQIADGSAVYGIDVRVPGIVHAALLQCPVHGGTLKNHDPAAALKMSGVRAVVVLDASKTRKTPVKSRATFGFADNQTQSGVAVIADHYWQARKALDAMPIEWDSGEGAKWTDGEAIYSTTKGALGGPGARTLRKAGDLAAATGRRLVSGEYLTPYCENATMEPLNATVLVTADAAEAWLPTQDQQQAFWTVIDETGLPPEKVKVHQTFVGGGFGRRTQADDVRMAVAVAKEFPGKPVKVIWSREETFRQGRFRTPVAAKFSAHLDDTTGLPQSFHGEVAYAGTSPTFQIPLGYFDMPYFNGGAIPNVLLSTSNLPVHVLNGAWRGPCYNSHAFTVETFIDECAFAAGIDPLDYRLKLLANWDPSWSDCLRLAASKAGWGKKLPKGEGLGIAISCWPVANVHKSGSVVATVARVSVARDGMLAVKQIDVAFDCGSVANSDAVLAQIEGATLFGMNAAINEDLTIKDGAIVEGNFDEYPMIRMADAPPLHVHFDALSGDQRMAIIGEAPTGPIQPAIGNAIYAATGKRVRRTPFRKQDLSWT